jgi:hypothetical protein
MYEGYNFQFKRKVLVCQIQATLVDLYVQEWTTGIHGHDKMSKYVTFKSIFGHELYLRNAKVPKFRIIPCQLRLSLHSLAI